MTIDPRSLHLRAPFIYFFLLVFSAALLFFAPLNIGFAEAADRGARAEYDVVVAGGGIGGVAAAIQAARLGASVLVVEPSDWIGGQATAAGVSTMDDMSRQRSGVYLEFITRLKNYYDLRGKSMGTCYWDPRSVAFEPSIGQKFLYEMLDDAKRTGKKPLDIELNSFVSRVSRDKNRVTGVTLTSSGRTRDIKCRVLIDATEYGDVLPLAGAEYRAGNSVTPFIKADAMIQDITWTAVLRRYPGGVPQHLRAVTPLPGYEEARRNYESYVITRGIIFKGNYPVPTPVDFASHNAYRGLPNSSAPWSYDASPENWKYISKTVANWGNDYPGKSGWENGHTGLPVLYLEDKSLRAKVEKEAFIKTLHFIYYIQNELGEDWSVTDDEYDARELPEAARGLPFEWHEIAKRMPPIPYVRESRRVLSEYTLTSEELLRNSLSYRDGQTRHEFEDAIAIGGYILDLHGADKDSDVEAETGERAVSAARNRPRGPFQVPLRILIPKEIDGLLAAEKNLSMTRLSAGAIRLQPICMMVGQAAGALAALSAAEGLAPRDVPAVKVQRALLEAGVVLSLCKYSDVPPEHPFFNAVQLFNLYGIMDPLSPPHAPSYNISDLDDPVLAMAVIRGADKGVFGVDELITQEDMVMILTKARVVSKTAKGEVPALTDKPDRFVTRGVFARALVSAFGFQTASAPVRRPFDVPDEHPSAPSVKILDSKGILSLYKNSNDFRPGRPVTRGEAAEMLMRAMTAD
ncbi:hypothetical protein FACS1894187_23280 [Synergistales bacterium]|nr:hypothetical protein FACS1894187_23280 [Synergistales bacterium]